MSDALVQIPEVDAVPVQAVGLFGGSGPVDTVHKATEIANALAHVIKAKGLYKQIGQKNHVFIEGWTLLGSMLGVYPVTCWSRPIEGGWEARVEARTISGAVVGAAEASCLASERNWKGKDDYAVRSMAQTRAAGKALRLPLGFVMVLAGYEACPVEEMPQEPSHAVRIDGPELTEALEASIRIEQGRKAEAAAEAKKDANLAARCPECASVTEFYASTQSGANAGRKYRQCKWAHDQIIEDMAHGVEQKAAYAGVSKHLREWTEPARKVAHGAAPEPGFTGEPPPAEGPAPSIFDPEQIAADVAARLAKKK
jgi:hypothetical protein